MDNKRALIAVAISFFILIGWGYLSEYMGWMPKTPPAAEQQTAQVATPATPEAPRAAPAPLFVPSPGREVTVKTPLYTAVLHSGGGVLRHFQLERYNTGIGAGSSKVDLVDTSANLMAPLGLLLNGQPSWSVGQWSFDGQGLDLAAGQSGTLRFVGEVNGVRLVRELEFQADTYLIREKVRLATADGVPVGVRLGFTVGTSRLTLAEDQYNQTRIAWDVAGKFDERTSTGDLEKGVLETGEMRWAGVMSNYFLAAVAPENGGNTTLKGKLQDGIYRVALEKADVEAKEGTVVGVSYWLGPKERELLSTAPNGLSEAINLGWFGFIARPLVTLLTFFYTYVGNYGVAILLLTLLIKIVFWPLSHKSYKSMEQMKKLQPMIQKLRDKYADDREKMNEEVMALYKTYKVNPAGGCLPMLVQIPVFFGLYQALLNAIELRHAPFIAHVPFTDFVWLADLSAKDPYYVTPLVMGATMFIQQKLTPPAGDPTQAKIMMFMPVVFTFMFLNFPSGLVIYWLLNNVLSITQQWWMLRKA